MTPVAVRTHRGHTSDIQLGGSGFASDLYLVYDDVPGVGISIGQIYSGVFMQLVGIPTIGTNHPEFQSLLQVQNINRRPAGNGWEVTVSYASASGSTNRPPVDPLVPFFTSIEETSRRDDVEFPVFERNKITIQAGSAGSIEKLVWDLSETQNVERRDTRVLTAVVNGEFGSGIGMTIGDFVSIFPAIGEQINKLHTFGGQQWRFVGAQRIAQESESTGGEPAKWSVRYEWEQDPGIPNAVLEGVPVGGMLFLENKAFVAQDANFRLRPYTAFYTGGDPEDPTLPPIATFIGNVVVDELGWQSLPRLMG